MGHLRALDIGVVNPREVLRDMKTVLLAGAFLLSSSFMMAQSQSPASTPPTLPQSQSQPSPDQNTATPSSSPSSTMPSASSDQQSSMGSQSASDNSASQKIEGCLSQGANGFTLADASGTTYNLTGDTSKLSSHVGEQVEVKGSKDSGSAASSAAPSASSDSSAASAGSSSAAGASAGQSITVHSVKRIAKTCSNAQPKQ